MAVYQYIARTSAGQKVSGVVEAGSESAASQMLGEQSLFPVSVQEQQSSQRTGDVTLRIRDLSAFYEQLADLLRAGVPILRALQTIINTSSNKSVQHVVKELVDRVSAGKGLYEAMTEQPRVFKTLQVAMVRAGERGGFLEQVMTDLATYLERQDELRGKVRGQLIYPAVLVVVGVGVVLACLVWFVPKFKTIFEGLDVPLPTRALFAASDALSVHWPMTLAAALSVGIAGFLWVRSASGQAMFQALVLRVPVVGKAILMVALTRFCRILGTMIAAGVPLLQALGIARDAAGLPALARATDNAIDSVRGGQGLTPPLRACGLIPPQITEMIAVAEESNQLEKTLLKIADTVERRTARQVDQAVRLLEPVILIVLAGAILFVALGLLFPIFTMAKMVQ